MQKQLSNGNTWCMAGSFILFFICSCRSAFKLGKPDWGSLLEFEDPWEELLSPTWSPLPVKLYRAPAGTDPVSDLISFDCHAAAIDTGSFPLKDDAVSNIFWSSSTGILLIISLSILSMSDVTSGELAQVWSYWNLSLRRKKTIGAFCEFLQETSR